ncbi:MAG: DUF1553 domain-containing protein, partial [Candidatus Hydrogenedentes bacterium]|nr:DUF1553 domain-containing protein [Candidatus Hydrogenedentota bacterium]
KDGVRPHAWRYRQWVIEALNRDLPYDQFVIEQLAGDLLPGATIEQLAATGFHRNTLTNREGGVDAEQYRVEQVVDRVNTTCSTFLGLTMACAQCHNHKYDPLTQREYYGLFAFFNTSIEKDIPAPLAPEVEAYKQSLARYEKEHEALTKTVDAYKPELAAKQPDWEKQQDLSDVAWKTLEPAGFLSEGGATFAKQPDGSLLISGNSTPKDRYTIVVTTDINGITAFRLDALPDQSLPKSGPGRSEAGNFVLSEFKVQAAQLTDQNTTQPVKIKTTWADFAQEGFPVANATDGKNDTGWSIAEVDTAGKPHMAVFIVEREVGYPAGTILTLNLEQQSGKQHTLGRFRLSATTAKESAASLPDEMRRILLVAEERRTDTDKAALLDYFGAFDPKMRELRAAVEGHRKGQPQPPATLAQTLAMNPDPPKTHVHIRGDFLRKGEEVQPHTPAVLPPVKPRGPIPDRLDLARWLVDPSNPLAARVAVNRMWDHLFGRGIVLSSEDFGTRGEPPSHPELLDWLATEFPARGWSMKEMIRLMVESATYCQSSFVRPELQDRDPNNVLVARQSRIRVEAEVTRDLCLAASGLLNPAVGGPSVRPQLPAGIAELGYAGQIKWPESKGEDRHRRGIYIFFQRTVPYPMLMTFDCPDSNVSCARRARSNTPLQALTLLNDPVFFECAQALGRRAIAEVPTDNAERARYVFRLCLGREPSANELESLNRLWAQQLETFGTDLDAAKQVATTYQPEGTPVPEVAASIVLARAVMNLDEFVTRE